MTKQLFLFHTCKTSMKKFYALTTLPPSPLVFPMRLQGVMGKTTFFFNCLDFFKMGNQIVYFLLILGLLCGCLVFLDMDTLCALKIS